MTTTEAIKGTLTPLVYEAIRKHTSSTEILKLAALHCFMYPLADDHMTPRELRIRDAMRELSENGIYKE